MQSFALLLTWSSAASALHRHRNGSVKFVNDADAKKAYTAKQSTESDGWGAAGSDARRRMLTSLSVATDRANENQMAWQMKKGLRRVQPDLHGLGGYLCDRVVTFAQ